MATRWYVCFNEASTVTNSKHVAASVFVLYTDNKDTFLFL